MGTGGCGEAFVKNELVGHEWGELWIAVEAGFEGAEGFGCVFVFGACKGDVGLVGPRLGDEAAWGGGSNDGLLKNQQRRSKFDVGEEDSRSIEGPGCFETDGDVGQADFAKALDEAVVLLLIGAAEKLEGDVPGFRRGPSERVVFGVETGG